MTIRGVRVEGDGTLDLTSIKLSLAQTLVIVLACTGVISTSAVSLHQLSELRREVAKQTELVTVLTSRVNMLELERARREGAAQLQGGIR